MKYRKGPVVVEAVTPRPPASSPKEGPGLASEMIRAALAHTRAHWPTVPEVGMITFVRPGAVRSSNPGYCYLKAGFEHEGWTPTGLRVLRLSPERMPDPQPEYHRQGTLWKVA